LFCEEIPKVSAGEFLFHGQFMENKKNFGIADFAAVEISGHGQDEIGIREE